MHQQLLAALAASVALMGGCGGSGGAVQNPTDWSASPTGVADVDAHILAELPDDRLEALAANPHMLAKEAASSCVSPEAAELRSMLHKLLVGLDYRLALTTVMIIDKKNRPDKAHVEAALTAVAAGQLNGDIDLALESLDMFHGRTRAVKRAVEAMQHQMEKLKTDLAAESPPLRYVEVVGTPSTKRIPYTTLKPGTSVLDYAAALSGKCGVNNKRLSALSMGQTLIVGSLLKALVREKDRQAKLEQVFQGLWEHSESARESFERIRKKGVMHYYNYMFRCFSWVLGTTGWRLPIDTPDKAVAQVELARSARAAFAAAQAKE